MSDFFIARPTTSDAATVTSSSEDTDYPATNLQAQQPRDYFRSSGTSDFYLTVDLGAAVAVNVIALLFTNADTDVQWRIRGAASEANLTASPGYDSGVIDHWPATDLSTWDRTHALQFLSTAQSYRWWRIDLSGLSGLSYYQAGRLYIDAAFNPTRSVDIDMEISYLDASIRAESQAATFIRAKKKKRRLDLSLSVRTESEAYEDHMDLQRLIGMGGDLLVCHDASSKVMERLFYSYIQSESSITHGQYSGSLSGNVHGLNYTFEEFEHP